MQRLKASAPSILGSIGVPQGIQQLKRKASNSWSAVQDTFYSTKDVFERHRVVFTIGTSIASVGTAWAGKAGTSHLVLLIMLMYLALKTVDAYYLRSSVHCGSLLVVCIGISDYLSEDGFGGFVLQYEFIAMNRPWRKSELAGNSLAILRANLPADSPHIQLPSGRASIPIGCQISYQLTNLRVMKFKGIFSACRWTAGRHLKTIWLSI
eukprot:Gb_18749 [translate_table: standard]